MTTSIIKIPSSSYPINAEYRRKLIMPMQYDLEPFFLALINVMTI